MTSPFDTPRTDALWGKMMDACRKNRIAPANANEAFDLLDDVRQLERSHARLQEALRPFADAVSDKPDARMVSTVDYLRWWQRAVNRVTPEQWEEARATLAAQGSK